MNRVSTPGPTRAAQGEEGRGGTDGENGNDPRGTINSHIILKIIAEIKRSFERSRKVRVKLLHRIHHYFHKISEMLDHDKESVQPLVMLHFEELQEVIVETLRLCLCLNQPVSKIPDIYGVMYDIGTALETLIIAVYDCCSSTEKLFGRVMSNFINSLLRTSCENPGYWLYHVMIAPIVLHTINSMFSEDHCGFRTQWAEKALPIMRMVAKAVIDCGDFGCQHYLMKVLHGWSQWCHPGMALPCINLMFRCVDGAHRKKLVTVKCEEFQQMAREFLNSLNLSATGPRNVIPIQSDYLFVGERKLNAEIEFWVDFSVVSGRLHSLFYHSGNGGDLISLSIRKDQIESICLNWVENDGKSLEPDSETQTDDTEATTATTSTFQKFEKVLFFHVVLSADFEEISKDFESLIGKKARSVYFVFRDGMMVERILREMGYAQHTCGTRKCQRPRALRRMLAEQNKLSYSRSWCPDSQVFGLDRTSSDCSKEKGSLNTTLNTTMFSVQRYHSPHSSYHSIPPGTELNLEVSSQENTQASAQDNVSDKENQAVCESTSSRTPNAVNLLETSREFYVSVTSGEDFAITEDEENASDAGKLDSTATTLYEDPLPRRARGKFRHLSQHSPFQQSSQVKDNRSMKMGTGPSPIQEAQEELNGSVDGMDLSSVRNLSFLGSSAMQKGQEELNDSSGMDLSSVRDLSFLTSSPIETVNLKMYRRLSPTSPIGAPSQNVFNSTMTQMEGDSVFEEEDENEEFENGFCATPSDQQPLTSQSSVTPRKSKQAGSNDGSPLVSLMEQQSSLEEEDEEDQDNESVCSVPTVVLSDSDESTIINESPSPHGVADEYAARSPTLSPIVGFSRPLVRGPELLGYEASNQSANVGTPNSQDSVRSFNSTRSKILDATQVSIFSQLSASRIPSIIGAGETLNSTSTGNEVIWTPSSSSHGSTQQYLSPEGNNPESVKEATTPQRISSLIFSVNDLVIPESDPITGTPDLQQGIDEMEIESENEQSSPSRTPIASFSKAPMTPKQRPKAKRNNQQTSILTLAHPSNVVQPPPEKLPCYSGAFQKRLSRHEKKAQNPDYDVYDMLNCSDFESSPERQERATVKRKTVLRKKEASKAPSPTKKKRTEAGNKESENAAVVTKTAAKNAKKKEATPSKKAPERENRRVTFRNF